MAGGLVDLVPLLAGAGLALLVLRAMAKRVVHPFDLEWMEGGMLVHVLRISRGQPLYTAPTADWIPYVYPPGYAAICALFCRFTGGVDYLVPRLVSVGSTLAACGALARLGALRGSLGAGIVGGIAFLLSYRASGAFFDMARPDALAMALLAWSLVLVLERRKGSAQAAGLLLAASFVVKHHTAAFGLPVAIGLWLRDGWRPALRYGLCALVPALLFTGYLQWRTDGRFLEYLVAVPSSHPQDTERIWPGLLVELGTWMLPAVLVSSGWLLARLPRGALATPLPVLALPPLALGAMVAWAAVAYGPVPGIGPSSPWVTAPSALALGAAAGTGLVHAFAPPRRADAGFWFAWLVGTVGMVVGGVMRGHNGGFMNVLMPLHWLLAAGLVVGVAALRASWPGLGGGLVGALLLSAQLAWGWETLELDPILPVPEDVRAGNAVVAALRACPEGPIFSPYAPWMVEQAGREPGLQLIALWDVTQEGGPFDDRTALVREAAQAHHWGCVLTNLQGRLGYGIDQSYPFAHTILVAPRALSGKTGWRVHPTRVLYAEPVEPARPGQEGK